MSYDHRLHYPWQYRRFFAKNEVFRLSECIVFRIPNELEHFRLGITLKSRGSSIERNRTKRSIRESMRILSESLGNYDYNVVVPNTKKLTWPYPLKIRNALLNELPAAMERKR